MPAEDLLREEMNREQTPNSLKNAIQSVLLSGDPKYPWGDNVLIEEMAQRIEARQAVDRDFTKLARKYRYLAKRTKDPFTLALYTHLLDFFESPVPYENLPAQIDKNREQATYWQQKDERLQKFIDERVN